jgi:cytochrome c oxidase subunit 4
MSETKITPTTYVVVFLLLLGLTALTVSVAYLDLGPLNTVAALGIAGAKALLVVLYFMHLRQSGQLVWLVAGSGVLFLAILIALTMGDFATRLWL